MIPLWLDRIAARIQSFGMQRLFSHAMSPWPAALPLRAQCVRGTLDVCASPKKEAATRFGQLAIHS
jgi:hypothetical protein